MIYVKKNLQKELDSLLGESIKNVYYHLEYEGSKVFTQLSDRIVDVPFFGILLETSSGSFYNIISFDYAPYYDLGGLRVFQIDSLESHKGIPNQINAVFWEQFKNKKIIEVTIIENFYKKDNEQLVVPFGIKLLFKKGKVCHIFNLCIHGYDEDANLYIFYRGEDVVLFSDENLLEKHEILKENTFFI